MYTLYIYIYIYIYYYIYYMYINFWWDHESVFFFLANCLL